MKYQPVSQQFSATDYGRVAVLMGDTSSEREVSLQSGRAVADALKSRGIDTILVDLQEDYLQQLTELKVDHAFIAMHGGLGESGHIQAILEALSIPYPGSGLEASAVAMNKVLTKRIWQGLDLLTPDFVVVDAATDWDKLVKRLKLPFIVKPACEGSTLGLSLVSTRQEWNEALALAHHYSGKIMAEQYIKGPEYTVAILNEQALPSIKIIPAQGMYDYDAKYISSSTKFLCPSDLNDEQEQSIRAIALEAFQAIGCSNWGRVDFMQTDSGEFSLLEVNTLPGLTSHSLVPMAAKAVDLEFADLIVEILAKTISQVTRRDQKQASVC